MFYHNLKCNDLDLHIQVHQATTAMFDIVLLYVNVHRKWTLFCLCQAVHLVMTLRDL
jgi:hypothetical protein